MASIVDSFKEVFGDKNAFIKLIVFAIAVNYDYSLYINANGIYIAFNIVTAIILFFLFGFLIKITNNIINERTETLPSLNPIPLSISSIKGIVAILPASLISILLANYICSLINTLPWFDYTIKTIIWLIAATIILTTFLMFAANEKIAEAFNLKVFAEKAGDIMVNIVVFIIQLILINLVTSGFIGYTSFVLFGFGPIFNFFISLIVVFNIFATGHYMGQMFYEHVKYAK